MEKPVEEKGGHQEVKKERKERRKGKGVNEENKYPRGTSNATTSFVVPK